MGCSVIKRRFLCELSCPVVAVLFLLQTNSSASAADPVSVTVNFCSAANDVGNEEFPHVRLHRDGNRMAELCGDPTSGGTLTAKLQVLFDPDAADSARLAAADDLRQFSGASPSEALHRMVQRRTEIVEAALKGLAKYPGDETARAHANAVVMRSAIDFESGGREFHGNIVYQALDALQATFPGVYVELYPVVARHFLNDNVHITISEPMASHIVHRVNDQSEGVRQFVLGACVTGCQSTRVVTRADVLPSLTSACWKIIGDGNTRTDTQAHKHPATIQAVGNHCFRLDRCMSLTGPRVAANPASICVDANNRITGVSTSFDRVPVARGIVRNIALAQANRKRPQSEAIAAQQIQDKAVPDFERRTDELPDSLNGFLGKLAKARQDYLNRAPTYGHFSSDDHIFFRSSTHSDVNLAGSEPPAYRLPYDTLTVQIHESTVNALIDLAGAFGQDRANEFLAKLLADYRAKSDAPLITDADAWKIARDLRQMLSGRELAEALEERLPALRPEVVRILGAVLPAAAVFGAGTELEIDPATLFRDAEKRERVLEIIAALKSGAVPVLEFKDCDPFRVRFDQGAIHLVLKSGPRRNKEKDPVDVESCKTCEKSIPFLVTNIDGKLGLQADREMPQEMRGLLDAIKASLRPKLRARLEEILRDRYADELINLPPELKLQVVHVEVTDGWINMELAPR